MPPFRGIAMFGRVFAVGSSMGTAVTPRARDAFIAGLRVSHGELMSKIDLRYLLSRSLVANANKPIESKNMTVPAASTANSPPSRTDDPPLMPPPSQPCPAAMHPQRRGARQSSAPPSAPRATLRALRPRRRT
jgi:hypothetical protein